ncbi:MAG: 4Fe-4S binding protein [Pleomorphochaeta sp.]
MKKVLVISGKGGTGKTTISSTLIDMLNIKALADCDVDAPNLHLVSSFDSSSLKYEDQYKGMDIYKINESECIKCGKCQQSCKFDSIDIVDGVFKINPLACEGCGVCEFVCPVNAISPVDNYVGVTQVFKTDKLFSTAQLTMGSGNSGKLVSQVKKNLDDNVEDEKIAIIDGSPGIGCPVIASLTGVDLALIVTEPSLSGLSDLKRIVKTAQVFKTKTAIVINKADLNNEVKEIIVKYINDENLYLAGEINYDNNVSKIINSKTSLANVNTPAANQLKQISKIVLSLVQ